MSRKKHSSVEGELSFLKMGTVLGRLTWGGIFLESQHSQIAVFEVKCELWPVDWN